MMNNGNDCLQFDTTITKNNLGEYAVNTDGDTLFNDPLFIANSNLKTRGTWRHWTPNIYTGNVGQTKMTIGNGSQDGYYLKIGRWVFFMLRIDFGSTTAFNNTGNLRFDIPIDIERAYLRNRGMDHGIIHGQAYTTKGIAYIRSQDFSGPLGMGFSLLSEADAIYTHNVPSSWGNGDIIWVCGWYGTWPKSGGVS